MGIDGVGKKMAKSLAKRYKSLDKIMNLTAEDLIELEDVGEITAVAIADFFADQTNRNEIEKLLALGIEFVSEEKAVGSIFEGKKL